MASTSKRAFLCQKYHKLRFIDGDIFKIFVKEYTGGAQFGVSYTWAVIISTSYEFGLYSISNAPKNHLTQGLNLPLNLRYEKWTFSPKEVLVQVNISQVSQNFSAAIFQIVFTGRCSMRPSLGSRRKFWAFLAIACFNLMNCCR